VKKVGGAYKCVPFASRELVITISWSRLHQFSGTQHNIRQLAAAARLTLRRACYAAPCIKSRCPLHSVCPSDCPRP